MPRGGRVDHAEHEARLAETARALVRLRSYTDVKLHLMKKYNVTARAACKWIADVKAQWRAEASTENVEESRKDIEKQLEAVIAFGWAATQIVKDKDGNPVLDPQSGKPIVKNEPKLQHVLHAISQLRAVRGADRPTKHVVQMDATVTQMPDLKALSPEGEEYLRKLLESVSPDNDLRKLAGSWFRPPEDK